MSITVISTPTKTVNGVTSNVVAGRSQIPFEFFVDDFDYPNYKVNIDVLDEDDNPYLEVTYKYSPKPDGTLFIDLGRIVTEINERRAALSINFKLSYYFTYDGGPVDTPTIIGPWLAVYAEKQLLSEGGSNMWDYILATPESKFLNKFLTRFQEGQIWDGFNRTYSYIIDSDYTARTGLSEVTTTFNYYDINKNLLSSITRVETDLTPRVVIAYIIPGYTPYVGVVIDGLTEEVLYKRAHACNNAIVIDWVNNKGGVDQFIFDIDQLYEVDSHEGLISELAMLEDISGVRRTKFRSAPTWTQQVILKAENLGLHQFKALQEIKSSISVRAWLNNNGQEWIGVICSSKYTTRNNSIDQLHEITLQMELPDNFDLQEAINYLDFEPEVLIDSDLEELIDSDNEILIG